MRNFLCAVLVFLLIISVPTSTYAHSTEFDGDISALLHIDPDDDPVAGRTNTLHFQVDDKTGKFFMKNCSCNATVSLSDQVIFDAPLKPGSNHPMERSGNINVFLPDKGIYTINFTGKPTDGNEFQPFTLSYTMRVDKKLGFFSFLLPLTTFLPKANAMPVLFAGFLTSLILYILYLAVIFLRRRRNGALHNRK